MKKLSFSAIIAIALMGGAVWAQTCEQPVPPSCVPRVPGNECRCGGPEYVCQTEPDEAKLIRHCCYVNAYGKEVHAPSCTDDGRAPKRAAARCRDGYYSFSEHRTGTCSSHGGVESWLGRL